MNKETKKKGFLAYLKENPIKNTTSEKFIKDDKKKVAILHLLNVLRSRKKTQKLADIKKSPKSWDKIQRNNIVETISFLRYKKMDYTITKTNGTIILESKLGKKIARPKGVSFKELAFIKKVRNHGKEICKQRPKKESELILKEDIRYVGYNTDILRNGYVLEHALEIDITSAYWELAYQMRIINKEIYDEGNVVKTSENNIGISKKCRLMALGSLAKKEEIYEYKAIDDYEKPIKHDQPFPELCYESKKSYSIATKEGGRLYCRESEKNDPYLRDLFLQVCKRMGDIMLQMEWELKHEYLFHWVDAVFIRDTPSNRKIVENILIKNVLKWKVYHLSVSVENGLITTLKKDKFDENGKNEEKRYHLPVRTRFQTYQDIFNTTIL